MKIGEQIIYKVTKASPLYVVIETFRVESQAALDRIHAFVKEVGAIQAFDNGYQCNGVEFAGDIIPDTWKRGRNVGGSQVSIPQTRTKVGRELQRRMDELTIPGSAVFAKMIHAGTDSVTVMHGPGERGVGGFRVRNARFDFIDGAYYVIVPIIPGNFKEPNIVEGGTRIRESEFIRILEDAGAPPYDTPGALSKSGKSVARKLDDALRLLISDQWLYSYHTTFDDFNSYPPEVKSALKAAAEACR